jgi:very-short-patch-repair endonuclease
MAPPLALESRLEHDLLRLIRASGASPPVTQHEAVVAGSRRVRFDFAWPERRLAVEADGRRWHATAADFQRDLIRHNAVTAAGWRLFRYGWADVHQRRAETLAELARLLAHPTAA